MMYREMADVPCGKSDIRLGRIKQGENARPGEFPWLVSLRPAKPPQNHYCGGTLINKRYVLTAAHCVHRNSPEYLVVFAGKQDFTTDGSEPPQILSVKNIISHANYSKRYINDIALLELKQEAKWTKLVKPICLPDREDKVDDGLSVTVAGWGLTDETVNGGTPSKILKKVAVKVINRTTCEDWYQQLVGSSNPLYDSHICAGLEEGGKDACRGDSGGPLMKSNNIGRQENIGVVSAGVGCGQPKVPGIYTRVSRFIDWIEDKMKVVAIQEN
ncbi:hypothetical protein SK128_014418 [Halocaridina rubra]|uniref:Peptidase S1 domain-containing protein n=1 Tax=Halocaridina rubra TaxID=373956 RepID=A0AAN8XDC2_HALRR